MYLNFKYILFYQSLSTSLRYTPSYFEGVPQRGWQANFLRKFGQSVVLISSWKSCKTQAQLTGGQEVAHLAVLALKKTLRQLMINNLSEEYKPQTHRTISEKFVCQPLSCVAFQIQTFQNFVLIAEYYVDGCQILQWRLLWRISAAINWSQM